MTVEIVTLTGKGVVILCAILLDDAGFPVIQESDEVIIAETTSLLVKVEVVNVDEAPDKIPFTNQL